MYVNKIVINFESQLNFVFDFQRFQLNEQHKQRNENNLSSEDEEEGEEEEEKNEEAKKNVNKRNIYLKIILVT